jgi:hypothetical protein
MQNVTWLSDLKIRGGYGTMGNSNAVNPNNQYTLYGGNIGASSYDLTGSNNGAQVGFYRTRIGNPDAKWETSVTSNLGFDALLFDGKLDIVLDFWRKDTRDLLLAVPITSTVGYRAEVPAVNIADMRNQGIDIGVTTKGNINTQWSYEVNVNGSFLQNEITGLPPGQQYLGSGTFNPSYRGIAPIRNGLNQSISSFFGYVVDGLWESNEAVKQADAIDGDASSEFQAGAAQGRFRYKDINNDGKINADDRTFIGSPVPKFTGGFNFTIRYANFDLYAYFYTSLGNKVFNVSKWFTDFYPSFQGAAISNRVKDSWTPDNLNAEIPIFESASNFSTNQQSNSFYVEDGSYLRLQNITLGYNLPSSLLNRWKMTKLRIFASTNNVLTVTGYKGLDPSVGGAVDTSYGIDVGNAPLNRSVTFGLNLGFSIDY